MSEKTIQLLFHNNYFIGISENHPLGQFSDIQLYQFQSVQVRGVSTLGLFIESGLLRNCLSMSVQLKEEGLVMRGEAKCSGPRRE